MVHLTGSGRKWNTIAEELMKTMKGLSQDTRRTDRDSNRELSAAKLMLTQAGRILITNPVVYSPAHTNTNLVKAI
jgi:hypothetical protein